MRSNFCIVCFVAIILLLSNDQMLCQGMKGKFCISLSRGLSSPIGDFAADAEEGGSFIESGGGAKSGNAFAGSLEYFLTNNLIIGGKVAYHPFDMKTENLGKEFEDAFKTALEVGGIYIYNININSDGSNKIPSYGLYLKYLFFTNANARPYLKFGSGGGNYKSSVDVVGLIKMLESETEYFDGAARVNVKGKFYLEGGGGCLFKLTDTIGIGSEILYSRLMTKDSKADIETTMEMFASTQEIREEIVKFNCDYISVFISLNIFFGGSKSK